MRYSDVYDFQYNNLISDIFSEYAVDPNVKSLEYGFDPKKRLETETEPKGPKTRYRKI